MKVQTKETIWYKIALMLPTSFNKRFLGNLTIVKIFLNGRHKANVKLSAAYK